MASWVSNDMEEDESVLWKSILQQVQADWTQARANFEGSRANWALARANEESSRATHLLTQCMPSMGAIEVVPDRLES